MTTQLMAWRLSACKETPPELVDLSSTPRNLDQASRQFPNGAYTTFRTFDREKALLLSDHFDRLEETARLEGQPITIDRDRLRQALLRAIAAFEGEARIRLTLDLSNQPGDIYISLEHLRTPSTDQYHYGVQIVTGRMHRENPRAKVTEFITRAGEVRQHLPEGIEEMVMVGDDGRVLEGLSSNFFAIFDGMLWTADEGVLKGITRSLALAAACKEGIPIQKEGIPVQKLGEIQEAFITSSTRGVLPVTIIDGSRVGEGVPGQITRKIQTRFDIDLCDLIEPINPG